LRGDCVAGGDQLTADGIVHSRIIVIITARAQVGHASATCAINRAQRGQVEISIEGGYLLVFGA
jgi:hypothetical protein